MVKHLPPTDCEFGAFAGFVSDNLRELLALFVVLGDSRRGTLRN